MSTYIEEHPTDDILGAIALGETSEELPAHLWACPSCSRQVKELRDLADTIAELPDEEPPSRMRDTVLAAARARRRATTEWFSLSCLQLLKTPLILVLVMLALVLFLYIFFVFIL